MKTIKRGSTGEEVRTLQKFLNLISDGKFGEITEEAVKEFQREQGLFADGIVGVKTWERIFAQRQDVSNGMRKADRKITGIIMHCTATPEGKTYCVEDIRRWHIDQGYSDIGYHYVVTLDGEVCEGRDVDIIGAHCKGHNTGTIGIAYVGGCDAAMHAKDTRTKKQKEALLSLVKKLKSMYKLKTTDIHGHYEYAAKACPSFDVALFRRDL